MTHVKYQQGILTAPNFGFSGGCVCVCVYVCVCVCVCVHMHTCTYVCLLEKNDAQRLTFLLQKSPNP